MQNNEAAGKLIFERELKHCDNNLVKLYEHLATFVQKTHNINASTKLKQFIKYFINALSYKEWCSIIYYNPTLFEETINDVEIDSTKKEVFTVMCYMATNSAVDVAKKVAGYKSTVDSLYWKIEKLEKTVEYQQKTLFKMMSKDKMK